MNLELKRITYNSRLSQETSAYAADLYLDGKKVAEVSNDGHGGCDHQYWFDREAEKKVTAYFRAMPKSDFGIDGKPFMMQPDLENWCGEQLANWLMVRDVKRSKKVIAIHNGKELSFKAPAVALDQPLGNGLTGRKILMDKYPGLVILNGLPDADIVKHLREIA